MGSTARFGCNLDSVNDYLHKKYNKIHKKHGFCGPVLAKKFFKIWNLLYRNSFKQVCRVTWSTMGSLTIKTLCNYLVRTFWAWQKWCAWMCVTLFTILDTKVHCDTLQKLKILCEYSEIGNLGPQLGPQVRNPRDPKKIQILSFFFFT